MTAKEKVPAEWHHLPVDHVIYAKSKMFIVFLDDEGDLDWETTDAADDHLEQSLAKGELSQFLNKAATLQAYPVEHLDAKQIKAFRIMIGEGIARGFDADGQQALKMMEEATAYVKGRSQEIARCWFLTSTFITTGVFLIVLIALWLFRGVIEQILPGESFKVVLGSCLGAVGAQLSILYRVGKTPLDPAIGKKLHYFEGAGSVIAGALGAVALQLGLLANVILPVLAVGNASGMFLVAFLAGLSERLVPSLVSKVETSAS